MSEDEQERRGRRRRRRRRRKKRDDAPEDRAARGAAKRKRADGKGASEKTKGDAKKRKRPPRGKETGGSMKRKDRPKDAKKGKGRSKDAKKGKGRSKDAKKQKGRSKKDERRSRKGGKGRKGRSRKKQPKVAAEKVPATPQGAAKMAKRHLGIDRLRPEQREAITALLDDRDAVVVLPTGYGKSLIYQATAMVLDRPTVVVSPLIALMRDQETTLHAHRIPALRLDSTLGAKGRRHALDRVRKGGRTILLTTPETLGREDVMDALREASPSLMCVDEAHCVSEWGHDFRPAYLRLGQHREALAIPRMLALTATATPRVREEIAQRLHMVEPAIVSAPPFRKNLSFEVIHAPGNLKFEAAGKLIRKLRRPGIVYCSTTKAVDQVYTSLQRAKIRSDRYHGKMKKADRDAAQRRFARTKGKPRVMVATSAFGMGIDRADIRYVMHFQVPGSLEQYVQEAGRAGRDGKKSRCVLLYDPDDLRIQEHLQDQSRASAAQLRRVVEALVAWIDDDRDVSPKELALSARVPTSSARVACAELEALGLLERTPKRRLRAAAPRNDILASAETLARQLETLRREDARRLRSMSDYAEEPVCRSVMIRRWFGEDEPPPCGKCDQCKRMR